MKPKTEYDKKIAKKFHDIRYYENNEYFVKNPETIKRDKEKHKTENKKKVTKKINYILKNVKKDNESKVFEIIQNIYKKNMEYAFNITNEKPINSDLLNILADKSLLTIAYKKVRKNKGASTGAYEMSKEKYEDLKPDEKSWVNKTYDSPDGINKELILLTSKLIRENRYPWGCSRRIYVDKPGKKDVKRPITIPPFMDKIVQEAITIILSAIYEPYFEIKNCSFGFRPNKGVHDAIVSLTNAKTIGLNMALEGDIKSAYDKVNRDILLKILSEKIHDRKFLNFIKNRLNYEFYDTKEEKYVKEKEGLPQGGIDSPYMWNIYMMKFDDYIIQHLNEKFNEMNNSKTTGNMQPSDKRKLEKKRTTIKKILKWINDKEKSKTLNILDQLEIMYKKGASQLMKEKEFKNLSSFKPILKEADIEEEKDIRKVKINLIKMNAKLTYKWTKLPSRDPNRIKLRFRYTRYADDWIILTNAKREILEKIKEEISQFLMNSLNAQLSMEKTLMTDIREDSAHFLGFEIRTYKENKLGRYKKNINGKSRIIKAYVAGYRVFAIPDRQRLIDRLHIKGYCDKDGFPREIGFLTKLDDFTIIERFNSVITGIANYYTEFIRNPKKNLGRWIYILRFACIKTLAHKHKTTVRKIFKKYSAPKDKNCKSRENTIMSKVINIIDNKEYQKTWVLKTLEKAIKGAMDLKIKPKTYDIFWILDSGKPIIYEGSNKHRITNDNFYEKLNWINIRTQSSFDMPCSICGSEEDIEMHHIKHVRKSNYRLIGNENTWMQAMSLRNRKQIPVCKNCHISIIHKGKYGGQKLSSYCPKIMYDSRIITIESHINKEALNNKEKINYSKTMEEKGWKLNN